jgi:hypothetical protein
MIKGSRYRWVGEGSDESRTGTVGSEGITAGYAGSRVTLYRRGEVVGMSYTSSVCRGGCGDEPAGGAAGI